MLEDLLHYIWKSKNFDVLNIQTVDNKNIRIINSGFWNRDAGPDFKQAIIEIDGVTWAGDVEIHIKSSDWYKHHHENDPKYNSVILHVVYEYDAEVTSCNGEKIPALELKNRIPSDTLLKFRRLSECEKRIPCKFALKDIPAAAFDEIILRTSMERLNRKSELIFDELRRCGHDWEEVCFRRLAYAFGCKTNSTAFELLSQSVEYHQIARHITSRLQIYAIIFGQAGLLNSEIEGDDYYEALQSEYNYLKYKYKWIPIDDKVWNKLRLRPANFHCLRLAQFCEVLLIPDIMKKMFDPTISINNLIDNKLELNDYWKRHYCFGKESKEHNTRIGGATLDLLYINGIIPIRYSFGLYSGNAVAAEQAVLFQKNIQFENNHVTSNYVEAGFPSRNAADSQTIIEINGHYCSKKRCTFCPVGQCILKKPP